MRTYKKIVINGQKIEGTPEQFESLFDVKDCEFENASILIWPKDNEYYWNNGTWINGIFTGDVWDNGTFKNGIFRGRVWEYGIWEKGIWEGKQWGNGEIYVPSLNDYVNSSLNPFETQLKYSTNFRSTKNILKKDQLQTPKEIRSIKDPTLYSIADKLVRI